MKTPLYLWFNELAAQFIEGASDAFLIVMGGSAIAQSGTIAMPSASPKQILLSVLLGGLLYAASYLKKTPLPTALPTKPTPPPAS